MAESNCDNTAFGYDRLCRLVFGRAQVNAQTALLPFIAPGSRGIAGILDDLCNIRPCGLNILYVDLGRQCFSFQKKHCWF